jgi:glycosyltransferase involved in cell wall biosynthesis
MFSDCYHPVINGVVTSIDVLRSNLMKAGHEIELFVPDKPGFSDHDLSIHRFFSLTAPFHKESRFTLPHPWGHIKRLQDWAPDVLHIHTPFNLGLVGLYVSEKLGLPYVFTHHTLWEEYVHYVPLVSRRLLRKTAIAVCRQFCNGASTVVAPSDEVKSRLLTQRVRQPIEVIPTGIDVECFAEGDGAAIRTRYGLLPEHRVAIYVGRMGKEKSLDFLLNAFAQVSREVPEARLLMVGGGPEKTVLEEQTRSLGLQDRVTFTGYVPRTDLASYFRAARVFLFSSVTETQGLVSLEAQASSCPVVAVRASGSNEAVADQETGFLVPQNEADFAAHTIRLLCDDALQARMASSALERALHFSSRIMVERHLQVYEQAVDDRRRNGRARRLARIRRRLMGLLGLPGSKVPR